MWKCKLFFFFFSLFFLFLSLLTYDFFSLLGQLIMGGTIYRIGGEMSYKVGQNAEIVGGKPQVLFSNIFLFFCFTISLFTIFLYFLCFFLFSPDHLFILFIF